MPAILLFAGMARSYTAESLSFLTQNGISRADPVNCLTLLIRPAGLIS